MQVVPALQQAGVSGGAYIGIRTRSELSVHRRRIHPTIAFIVDVRRDNLLLHLLFKSLFAEAGTRIEYVSLLFGRAPPPRPAEWTSATAATVGGVYQPADPAMSATRALDARVDARLATFGVPLSAQDRATIHASTIASSTPACA